MNFTGYKISMRAPIEKHHIKKHLANIFYSVDINRTGSIDIL